MSGNLSTTTIQYFEDALVIRLQTGSPAALHFSLMKGIISSLKLQILSPDRLDEDVDGLAALANMLSKAIPTEMHLQKAYSPAA